MTLHLLIFVFCLPTATIAKTEKNTTTHHIFDSELLRMFSLQNEQSVLVTFNQNIHSVITSIDSVNYTNIAKKRYVLVKAMKEFTENAQLPFQKLLKSLGIKYIPFWISNTMVIDNITLPTATLLANIPGILSIQPEPTYNIDSVSLEHILESIHKFHSRNLGTPNKTYFTGKHPWGVKYIRADQVWSKYNLKGRNVVVANIDTGVRYTHESLVDGWRSNYGWYDPLHKTSVPDDRDGHGTHTMATICGKKVGVAPRAKWISCRGCFDRHKCSIRALKLCTQWLICPYTKSGSEIKYDCKMAPHIVSNSWNGGKVFQAAILALKSAGITTVFSIGNSGPECGSAQYPATEPFKNLIAVGSIAEDETVAKTSGRGSFGKSGEVKPDLVAPGMKIWSAGIDHDSDYREKSGSSMACPHVAGVIALMLEKNKELRDKRDHEWIHAVVTRTTVRRRLQTLNDGDETCGNISTSRVPNNVFGWGSIDAMAAVKKV